MSKDDLAAGVALVARDLGHTPSVRQYNDYRRLYPYCAIACSATVRERFGSWPAALEAAENLVVDTCDID